MLLAESFSSQVAWALLNHAAAKGFVIEGIILSGGFVRYPAMYRVRFARMINRAMPMWMLRALLRGYAIYARFRHRRAQETLKDVGEFVRRRSQERDRAAICQRYNLILNSDFRELVCKCSVPIYQLSGLFDPVVPWLGVRRWLKRNCPSYRGSKIIATADHNVLGTAPTKPADQVWRWMSESASK